MFLPSLTISHLVFVVSVMAFDII